MGLEKRIPIFSIDQCKFGIEKGKESTARNVLFKELGILSSFTLECTYYGSEFLKRHKPGFFLLTKEEQEQMTERYGMSFARKDISIDTEMCGLIGADFMMGINYASKKRPLLGYWFRNPPKNIIEPFIRGAQHQPDDIDPALLELEKAWRPIGAVNQDKYLGIGDRFEDGKDPFAPRTPPEEEKKGRKIDT